MSHASRDEEIMEVPEPEELTGDQLEPDEQPEPEQDDDEPEASTEQPVHESSTEFQMEEIGKKLDGLNKHVAKRLGEILGDDATLFEVCEVCSATNTPGYRLSGPYPPEVEAAVRHVMGQHSPTDYSPDSYSRKCDKCNGLGATASGSLVPGQDTLPCFDCKARGWVPVGTERSGLSVVPPSGGDGGGEQAPPFVPAPVESDTPEVAALKAQGYVIIAPTR